MDVSDCFSTARQRQLTSDLLDNDNAMIMTLILVIAMNIGDKDQEDT